MSGRLRDKYRTFKSGAEKRKLKITKEHQHERQKNSLFKFFKKDQNYSTAGSGQIERQINKNFQLSDSDDNINSEKVQSSDSDDDEYENIKLNDDLQPKVDIESKEVPEEENCDNDDPGN